MSGGIERPRRLNWGCGSWTVPGWINSDVKDDPGIDLSCDIREGLPLADGSMEYVVSAHALPEIAFGDLVPVLRELRRVLAPGGVLRLSVPDVDRVIRAYLDGERDVFLVPDEDAATLAGKFAVQLTWYGYSRSLYTAEFTEELLVRAGFTRVEHCRFGETASEHPGITELDNREPESLFVEAFK